MFCLGEYELWCTVASWSSLLQSHFSVTLVSLAFEVSAVAEIESVQLLDSVLPASRSSSALVLMVALVW